MIPGGRLVFKDLKFSARRPWPWSTESSIEVVLSSIKQKFDMISGFLWRHPGVKKYAWIGGNLRSLWQPPQLYLADIKTTDRR